MKSPLPTLQIQFDSDKDVICPVPETAEIYINNMQLEINCGFNMYTKKLKIIVLGEENEFELPIITLSQMYKLRVPVELPGNGQQWRVRGLLIRPCQKNNYSVFIGISAS